MLMAYLCFQLLANGTRVLELLMLTLFLLWNSASEQGEVLYWQIPKGIFEFLLW